jgi:hypothetical protein
MGIEDKYFADRKTRLKIAMAFLALLVYVTFSFLRPGELNSFHFWMFSTAVFFMSSWFLFPSGGLKKGLLKSLISASSTLLFAAIFFGFFFIYKMDSGSKGKLKPSAIFENVPDFIFLCMSASFFSWAWLSIFIASLVVMIIVKIRNA